MEQDEYATLRAAEAAGARIQAYTVDGDYFGVRPMSEVEGTGYWRTISGASKFTCHPSRYRVHPEDLHGVTPEECAPQRLEDVL